MSAVDSILDELTGRVDLLLVQPQVTLRERTIRFDEQRIGLVQQGRRIAPTTARWFGRVGLRPRRRFGRRGDLLAEVSTESGEQPGQCLRDRRLEHCTVVVRHDDGAVLGDRTDIGRVLTAPTRSTGARRSTRRRPGSSADRRSGPGCRRRRRCRARSDARSPRSIRPGRPPGADHREGRRRDPRRCRW